MYLFIGTIHLLSRAISNQIKQKILNNDISTSIGEGTTLHSSSTTTSWNQEHGNVQTIKRFWFEFDYTDSAVLPKMYGVIRHKTYKENENKAYIIVQSSPCVIPVSTLIWMGFMVSKKMYR